MPITASELGASPTLVYPLRSDVENLLSDIGTVIALADEGQFDAGTVSAAIYGWALALIQYGADWSVTHGLDETTPRQLVARTFVASGRMVAEQNTPMSDLLAGLATPGGVTEAGLTHLQSKGVTQAWEGACNVVLAKLQENS